ncbi:c-type cytochrome [Solirhodobacter olei]|uniref:c-type cytochrome n=1 Tax=Solirhodobacter olei TaxID=2493082 RepID=UPI000FD7454E|nr:c-type cytochrome [Solirhodobacter olei]
MPALRISPALATLAASLALSLAAPARAQDESVGKALFASNCAACHGETAKGDGDMAGVMTIPAPDLTLLARQNDGTFPFLKVFHVIDGRTGVRSHGNPMPVFGRSFEAAQGGADNPFGAVIEARGKVMSIALYLESLQR